VNEEPKILYVHTSGTDAPERSATPFYLATAGAAMDAEVSIFFTVKGPSLLQKGVAETLVIPKPGGEGAPLITFIKQAQSVGVKFYVCQPSLELNGLTMDDLIDGVAIIGGAAFNAMALEADAVLSF
jgi:uncharacterized protein